MSTKKKEEKEKKKMMIREVEEEGIKIFFSTSIRLLVLHPFKMVHIFYRLRNKNSSLYIHKWIYTAKGYTTKANIDSKPHTEVNQETRRKTHKKKRKRKTKLQTSSPPMLQTNLHSLTKPFLHN
jgi:hypothetical protein